MDTKNRRLNLIKHNMVLKYSFLIYHSKDTTIWSQEKATIDTYIYINPLQHDMTSHDDNFPCGMEQLLVTI